jgi:aspartate/methionine/tyrosine aminotransferase
VKFAEAEPGLRAGPTRTTRFQLSAEAVKARLTDHTKAIVINSPANPTGTILGPDRMAALAQSEPWIVSDEIYPRADIRRPRAQHSRVHRPGLRPQRAFSKAFAMTGWRIGYLIAPRQFMPTLQATTRNFFISANEFVSGLRWRRSERLLRTPLDFGRIFDERRHAMVGRAQARRAGCGSPADRGLLRAANARRYTNDSLRVCLRPARTRARRRHSGDRFRSATPKGTCGFTYAASLERIEEGLPGSVVFLSAQLS